MTIFIMGYIIFVLTTIILGLVAEIFSKTPPERLIDWAKYILCFIPLMNVVVFIVAVLIILYSLRDSPIWDTKI